VETKNQPVKSHQTIDEFIQSVKRGLLGRSNAAMPHTSQARHRDEHALRPTHFKSHYSAPLEARRKWKLYRQYSH